MKTNVIRSAAPYTPLLLSSCLFYSLNTQADSWEITQTTTFGTNTELSQTNTNNSLQAANAINLDSTNGIVVDANQTLTTTGTRDVTLSQDGTDNSQQVANFISAAQITEATQSINNVNTLTFSQQNAGNNNIQAGNMAVATGANAQIDILTQTVSANFVTFEGSGTNNIQAGNYAKATTINNGTQNFTVAHDVNFNGSGSNNIQAGNYVELEAGNVTQNFNATGDVNYVQTGTNNIQAGNVALYTTAVDPQVTQNFSSANVNADFSDTNNATGSIKAANYSAQKS